MLTPATLQDVERYGERMYALALDPARSAYPTYTDGIKTKADFLDSARRAVEAENAVLLLFSAKEQVEGWLMLDWIEADRYLQLCGCCIAGVGQTPTALSELLDWLRAQRRFSGYTLYCGFPGENVQALAFLRRAGFDCVEQSWNHVFSFDPSGRGEGLPAGGTLPAGEWVAPPAGPGYDDLRAVYHPDEATYWTCDRILQCPDRWSIFVYYAGEGPAGAVLTQNNGSAGEIFGLVLPGDERDARAARALLAAALGAARRAGARHLIFFCEEEVRPAVRALGFRCVGQYLCFTHTF